MDQSDDKRTRYRSGSLSLPGAVAMGTGVMIGAGIFALTGQVAEQARAWFPLAFVAAAIVSALSAYSYVKMASAEPSAGGIAMILTKAYGESLTTAVASLLMYVSMVINESLVARTFGTYVLQPLGVEPSSVLVPVLGIGLLLFALAVNLGGNRMVQAVSSITALLKIGGLIMLAGGGLWAAGLSLPSVEGAPAGGGAGGFLAGTALAVLAFKGFTTITNSGSEITEPHRNVGRAIMISIAICLGVYAFVTVALGATLSVGEIVEARDYSLAAAARPAFGAAGEWITVGFAVLASASGLIASAFAVSRMLAMLTDMRLVPHRHFGMPGSIQKHTLVYTIVLAGVLTLALDLSRIAALGAIFYLLMDVAVHWGVLRHTREDVGARAWVLIAAITADVAVLVALLVVKGRDDPLVVWGAGAGLAFLIGAEALFLRASRSSGTGSDQGAEDETEGAGAGHDRRAAGGR